MLTVQLQIRDIFYVIMRSGNGAGNESSDFSLVARLIFRDQYAPAKQV